MEGWVKETALGLDIGLAWRLNHDGHLKGFFFRVGLRNFLKELDALGIQLRKREVGAEVGGIKKAILACSGEVEGREERV